MCAPEKHLIRVDLPGAVVADDGENLAGVELEAHSVERDDAAERLDEVDPLDDGGDCRGGGHAFTFLIHWSMATAAMTRMPTARTR